MLKLIRSLPLFLGLGLSSCATSVVTVIPEANNKYSISSSSKTYDKALHDGMDAATATCVKQDKQLQVMYYDSSCRLTDGVKDVVNSLATTLNTPIHDYVKTQDYRVWIYFTCVNIK